MNVDLVPFSSIEHIKQIYIYIGTYMINLIYIYSIYIYTVYIYSVYIYYFLKFIKFCNMYIFDNHHPIHDITDPPG